VRAGRRERGRADLRRARERGRHVDVARGIDRDGALRAPRSPARVAARVGERPHLAAQRVRRPRRGGRVGRAGIDDRSARVGARVGDGDDRGRRALLAHGDDLAGVPGAVGRRDAVRRRRGRADARLGARRQPVIPRVRVGRRAACGRGRQRRALAGAHRRAPGRDGHLERRRGGIAATGERRGVAVVDAHFARIRRLPRPAGDDAARQEKEKRGAADLRHA
jgi:hypothetical protein